MDATFFCLPPATWRKANGFMLLQQRKPSTSQRVDEIAVRHRPELAKSAPAKAKGRWPL